MDNTKYWIALEQAQGMGPAHLKEIRQMLESRQLDIIDLFDLTAEEIKNEFSFSDKIARAIVEAQTILTEIADDYSAMLESEVATIPFFSSNYPRRLHDILGNAIPPILYVLGNINLLEQTTIAILGDKNISEKGKQISYVAAKELSHHSICVASGLASGVGHIAHRSALENMGTTIAIVPYGFNYFNPPRYVHDVMDLERIAIVSPFYASKEPNQYNAYIRNKYICALSKAVYIVESPLDGGIFEAAKSSQKLGVPLFTTQYSEYPENAEGNKKILEHMGGNPIRGRLENDLLVPNMEKIIACAKF